jgi:hypothetical protein
VTTVVVDRGPLWTLRTDSSKSPCDTIPHLRTRVVINSIPAIFELYVSDGALLSGDKPVTNVQIMPAAAHVPKISLGSCANVSLHSLKFGPF